MKPGLYDHILTKAIEAQIDQLSDPRLASIAPIDPEESHAVIAQYLERLIASSLSLFRGADAADRQYQLVERIIQTLSDTLIEQGSIELSIATPLRRLLAIHQAIQSGIQERPDSPLSRSSLFTGTRLDASLGSQLCKEISTCDRVDILCSFIKWSGLRVLLGSLRELTDRGSGAHPLIRVITTSYMGATDPKAIEMLRQLPGV
ncbi:MAG: NgoFVII family restriction endonuclease, partial [Pirellula sp.]